MMMILRSYGCNAIIARIGIINFAFFLTVDVMKVVKCYLCV